MAMTAKTWHIETPAPRDVHIEHNVWSGYVNIQVDEESIFERSSKFWDTGCEYRFKIDGIPCIVRAIARPFHFTYELWVDGKLQ